MVDRLMVHCVIPRNAEVWTCDEIMSVLVGMQSGIDNDNGHGTGPRGSDNVNSKSTLSLIERRTN